MAAVATAGEAGAVIRITPVQNAVWGYAEWCCDRGLPWPKLSTVARDLARCECEVRRALAALENLGVLSRINTGRVLGAVRLGDGRETRMVTPDIHIIHRRHNRVRRGVSVLYSDAVPLRRAA